MIRILSEKSLILQGRERMITYVRGLNIPSHLEKHYFMVRAQLIDQEGFIPYPYLPMLPLSFSEVPFANQRRETLYMVDLLGEGGLIMDRLIENKGLLYWGSSRLESISQLYSPSIIETPITPGKGILLGKINKNSMYEKYNIPGVNWKKAPLIYAEIDFAPPRNQNNQEYWPRAVRWRVS
jgi:hypothetical protein